MLGKQAQPSVPTSHAPPPVLELAALLTLLLAEADAEDEELLELLVDTGVGVYALRRDGISVKNPPSLGCSGSSGLPAYGMAVK